MFISYVLLRWSFASCDVFLWLPGDDEHRRERERLLKERRELRATLPDSEDLVEIQLKLTLATKRCKKMRREWNKKVKKCRVEDMFEAEKQNKPALVARISRQIAQTGIGPKTETTS